MKKCPLPLVLLLTLTACAGGDIVVRPAATPLAATSDIQIGLVCGGGEAQALLNSRKATEEALAAQGIAVTWQVIEDVAQPQAVTQANRTLAQAGCHLVLNSAADMESAVGTVALDYPDVHFITCGGTHSWQDSLENTHTAYARTYELCYLAGLAAGEGYQTGSGETAPVWGYVAHRALAADISDFSAYYLGLRSACPNAAMKVYYIGSEGGEEALSQAVAVLEGAGCTYITLPGDPGGADSAIDWSAYLTDAALTLALGESLPQDVQGGFPDGWLALPQGSDGAGGVAQAAAELTDGRRQVFDTAAFTVEGEGLKRAFALDTDGDYIPDAGEAVFDGAFHEGYYRSAPYFDYRVDGIEWLNAIF